MIDRHNDHVALSRQGGTVVHRRAARAVGEAAAVKPDHDRTGAGVHAGRPEIQEQSVLTSP